MERLVVFNAPLGLFSVFTSFLNVLGEGEYAFFSAG
jgi:hypothetical protein